MKLNKRKIILMPLHDLGIARGKGVGTDLLEHASRAFVMGGRMGLSHPPEKKLCWQILCCKLLVLVNYSAHLILLWFAMANFKENCEENLWWD